MKDNIFKNLFLLIFITIVRGVGQPSKFGRVIKKINKELLHHNTFEYNKPTKLNLQKMSVF